MVVDWLHCISADAVCAKCMSYFAHSKEDESPETWEPLFTPFSKISKISKSENVCEAAECSRCESLEPLHGHLNKVGFWAAKFASQMIPRERETLAGWARAAGLWHDLGKFSKKFQSYLKDGKEKVDHSSAGAQHAIKAMEMEMAEAAVFCYRVDGQIKKTKVSDILPHCIAYGIAGHHSGLLDAKTNGESCQFARLKKGLESIADCPDALLKMETIALPSFIKTALGEPKRGAFTLSFFSRMLFSCLVDADFLATESFMNPEKVRLRNQIPHDALSQILDLLEKKLDKFGEPTNEVNRQRAKLAHDCRKSAKESPGIFTLTVPTGGGKTLASLLFALKHALAHGQSRILYVVPFTSIIEQNAEVIREIIKPIETENFTPLIEHHASFELDENESDAKKIRLKLATENWDAPLIMTTAVQFYESLFAAKTSRARKLHNIANSVIVLDEAQTLPVDLLSPCLRVLKELSENYHATIILCTATQPAIRFDKMDFPIGFKGLDSREIVSDSRSLFNVLKRVSIKHCGQMSDEDLASKLSEESQVLCIVNRRAHAQALFQKLANANHTNGEKSSENFHLSALMCPAHRSEILQKVRHRLDEKLPTRLIATQVIEAGVDIDFPMVYRALAGLDSIAQAAGRCNREGKLREGRVFVFEPEDVKGEKFFRETANVASEIIELKKEGQLDGDLLGEEAIRKYFDIYYYREGEKCGWDEKCILEKFRLHECNRDFPLAFAFASAARDFKLIDEIYEPIIIPFDEKALERIEQLKCEKIPLNRDLLRGLQRYTVQIAPRIRKENVNSFDSFRDDAFHVLISLKPNYSLNFGLTFDEKYVSSQFYHT